MNRVQHILHAFSPIQIRFLLELVQKRRDDKNNLVVMTPEEEYALELLEKADKSI